MFSKRRPTLMLVLIVALMLLLPLLAFLQFRWLGEVSHAERERMQSSLNRAVESFSQDFDRELTLAYLALQMDAKTLHDRSWQDYAMRYDQWLRRAPHPELVASVFLVEPGSGLARFDRATGEFEPARWPSELAPLSQRFAEQFKAARDETKPALMTPIDTLIEEGPALAAPVAELSDTRNVPGPMNISGYILVMLDLSFIKEQFIPSLAERYFANGSGLDCSLAITSRRAPERIIYQSEPQLPENPPGAGDATATVFNVRMEEAPLSETVNREVETSDAGVEKKENLTFRVFNTVLKKDAGARSLPPPRVTLINGEGGRWQVALKHRAGSLDLAVASARRRNLAISFAVLLLLSVSVTMIILSARRAANLAAEQMEFVAGVSHEMRTPLAVIRSAGQNLADGVIDERKQVRRYGALIESEGRRLTEMIEQALEFAGIQSGRKTYALAAADPGSIIESALAATEPLIQKGGFKIEKEIAPDLPLIQADAAALSRAIQNLLNNAMKYSGESLSIKIKAGMAASEQREEMRITVEDRGLGIPPSEAKRIFEPFFRGSLATAAQIHGSGLGLSLVKRIIEAHGGRVSVKSADRRGSAFTLHLPAKTTASRQRATVSNQPAAASGNEPV